MKAKIDDSIIDKQGRTALLYAADAGRLEVIEKLVLNGNDVNKGDNELDRPIHLVAHKNHSEVCQFLIKSKSDIDAQNMVNIFFLFNSKNSKVCYMLRLFKIFYI